jgi:crotonobetainyl-CoA:carnitine CoA-transferase CaiB-like acyl-CoA transferase
MTAAVRSGPLAGVRVLEVGHILAGPFAAMVLADLGADVIKIESDDGDLSRKVSSAAVDGHPAYFASLNRSKRSVRIDLTTPDGQAQLGRLAATADALVVNLRPSAIRKLGLTYEALREHNEKIVCVAITGFGMDGPSADWPAFDYIVQALAGVAALTGEPDGPPSLAGYSVIDNSVSLMAATGLLAKLVEGRGGQVEVSLFDTMLAQLNYKAADYLNGGPAPRRRALGAHLFYVPAQLFETAQGYLALFVSHDAMWRTLCVEIGEPEWADDPRYATMAARHRNRDELLAGLAPRLKEASAQEWTDRLRPLGLPVGPVLGLAEALDSETVRSAGMVVPLETAAGPLLVLGNPLVVDGSRGRYRPPPRLHEHTDDVLQEGTD